MRFKPILNLLSERQKISNMESSCNIYLDQRLKVGLAMTSCVSSLLLGGLSIWSISYCLV
jgi:hypothetical protein